jgi:hypothetical protein
MPDAPMDYTLRMAFESEIGKQIIVSISPVDKDATVANVQAFMGEMVSNSQLYIHRPVAVLGAEIVSRGVKRIFKD